MDVLTDIAMRLCSLENLFLRKASLRDDKRRHRNATRRLEAGVEQELSECRAEGCEFRKWEEMLNNKKNFITKFFHLARSLALQL
jgi:hypothetical protein